MDTNVNANSNNNKLSLSEKKTARLKVWRRRYSPPGMTDDVEWASFVFYCLGALAAFVLIFTVRYADAYNALRMYIEDNCGDSGGAKIASFWSFMPPWVVCCIIILLVLSLEAGHILRRLLYLRQGSMSIYTLRRLPQRGEVLRRVAVLPLARCICTAALIALTMLLCYAAYLLITPASCLG